ncbi:16S rRNA (guanine(527)-N(7))-methyltransferase RsmG [Sphingosinicella rhizophila]|uniref:Ribosomal RNA small subunit methyltransferase G n=1 Tax=Sphingosinicella rhizophila TaxID=3050082 RepID=A0ABU3Q833_9SPHN|nr:16S rRNA (guanine(527)-N(7))-methyltransferase RsmG [Sphingosinicella sp. GR2756]MDT9599561.1 16S rRNA (guanine(527)-N(7))-methyltransferase RsmG [Sphingosinicella sp. GR2756]
MTEEEAKARLDVPRETLERLEAFVSLLKEENRRQNLVSEASLAQVWSRHVLDSAQLLAFSPAPAARWLDIGTGAGFPGLIVAMLHRGKTVMVESRKLRTDFLHRAIALTDIGDRATIVETRVERMEGSLFDAISARACASLDQLFGLAARFAAPETRWILPKGRKAKSELDAALASWQGRFRLEPSLTDPDAMIVIGEAVHRRHEGNWAR